MTVGQESYNHGVKLEAGNVLEGTSTGREIPRWDNENYREFADSFQEYSEAENPTKKAEEIVQFTNEWFDYDPSGMNYNPFTGEELDNIPLDLSTKLGKGVCKDQAAAAQMLMQENGIESRYTKGLVESRPENPQSFEVEGDYYGKHAWLTVETEKDVFYADPTNNKFTSYEDKEDELIHLEQEILEP